MAMDLEKTARLMKSSDYKDRFIGEYWQLQIRAYKLYDMIVKYRGGDLGFEPTCPIELLETQYHAMKAYQGVLEERAKIEKVDIYDDEVLNG